MRAYETPAIEDLGSIADHTFWSGKKKKGGHSLTGSYTYTKA